MPIDRFAGVAPQFERTDGGYFFRRDGCGPAIRVSEAERDTFAAAGMRSLAIHAVALIVCTYAGWLLVDRMMAGRSENLTAGIFGVVLSLIAMALYGSLRWNADAPGRALAGRPAERPARDPDFAQHESYGTIGCVTIFVLFLAAIGTKQPASFYVTFAVVGVMAGLFAAIRKWWFDTGLTPDQRRRAKQVEQREARYAEERGKAGRRADSMSYWTGALVLFFVVLQLALVIGGFICGMAITMAIAGTTMELASGWTMAIAIVSGLIAGGVLGWAVERLCKRLTGESAIAVFAIFDFIPAGW